MLVCISKTPDTTAKIAFTNNNSTFDTNGVTFIMNPTDEWYALVRAIEIKEQLGSGTVTVINVGPKENESIVIQKALAIGADNAVRIDATPDDAHFVAAQIAAHAESENYDIIFTGKETIDYNGSSIGGMVAELLNLPYISLANSLQLINTTTAAATREIEGGVEELEVDFPFVISAQKGMAEQRIPNMRGIMSARSKPITVLPPKAVTEFTAIIAYELPPARTQVKLIDPEHPEELIRLLHEQAKVI